MPGYHRRRGLRVLACRVRAVRVGALGQCAAVHTPAALILLCGEDKNVSENNENARADADRRLAQHGYTISEFPIFTESLPRPRAPKKSPRNRALDAMSANSITNDILLMIGREFPHVRAWRNNAGAAKRRGRGIVRFGTPGQGDISGLIGPSGRRLEIEVKAGRDAQSKRQELFQAMCERHGGLYVLARSVEDVRCQRGLVYVTEPGAEVINGKVSTERYRKVTEVSRG